MRHGPSERDLAKAFLVEQSRQAILQLLDCTRDDFEELFAAMVDLPTRHLTLQLRLPRLLGPQLEALRTAIEVDDDDGIDEHVGAALSVLDSPEGRAELARAVLALVDDKRVTADVGAVALASLATEHSALMRASLLQALSVLVGRAPTPSGLLVIAR